MLIQSLSKTLLLIDNMLYSIKKPELLEFWINHVEPVVIVVVGAGVVVVVVVAATKKHCKNQQLIQAINLPFHWRI